MKSFFLILLSLLSFSCEAQTALDQTLIASSHQLVFVSNLQGSKTEGRLERYQRSNSKAAWQAVGQPIPVVIGRGGMSRVKVEGDQTSPEGVYSLGPTFGFALKSPFQSLNMNYRALSSTTVCVDDSRSKYYNQVVDAKMLSDPDWQSAESMHQQALYQWGVVVQYNQLPVHAAKGSCIFLHRWRSRYSGTAGCVAMNAQHLESLILWLDQKKSPVIALVSASYAKEFKKKWGLD